VKTRREVSAGGVLYRRSAAGAEILLASRRTRSGELVWGLPKGLVERGESPEDTAVREVQEETGFEGKIEDSLGEIGYWYVWEGIRVRKTVHFFLMEAIAGDISRRDREMEDVAWFPLAEAEEAAGFASEQEIVARAHEYLEKEVGGSPA
jgi:8-oxo-dGTP pyrophosphatase MutT (NUDIX family)